MGHKNLRELGRLKRKLVIRQRVSGTPERPRLTVFRSAKHLYVQIIDDVKRETLVSASTIDKALKGKIKGTVEGATAMGKIVANRALQKGLKKIVFDRSGFRYHGQLKALAEAVREGGLEF